MGSSIVKELYDAGKLPGLPKFVTTNMCHEVISGSTAYGVSGTVSDWDIVGICIPKKEMIFPHLAGNIVGFGHQVQSFKTTHRTGITHKEKEYDITVYGIVRFFDLCMEMNPNMIALLYVPDNCVLHSTQIGNLIRENRSIFLSKLCWPRYKGYAYSQLKKMQNKEPEGKRKKLVDKYGYDTKYAYNLVRLMGEVEQLLTTGELDLQQDRERLKAIRRGEWTQEQIQEFFTQKEKGLETAYNESSLPYSPDEAKIKDLLIRCLKLHYGDLSDAITIPGQAEQALREIQKICERFSR